VNLFFPPYKNQYFLIRQILEKRLVMKHRIERLNEQFKQDISIIVQQEVKDPRVSGAFVTVLEVDTAPDLSNAKVYVSIFYGDKFKIIEGLNSSAGFIRSLLLKRIQIRKIPRFEFFLDETNIRADRINRIINKIHEGEGKSV